jgi:hypothetical protein
MKPDRDEQMENPVLATMTSLARLSAPPATPTHLGRGWSAVSARLSARDVRRRALVRWSMVGAVATAAVFAVLGIVAWSRMHKAAPAMLAFKIEGGTVIEGGYLRESGNEGVKLLFSEGTEFILMSGTRGRLHAVDSAGARIAIEHGTASFQVTPNREARWLVDVGPFLVTVKGTVFSVSWDATSERFELRLQHGQVSVTGPVAGGAIALRAGQRLVIHLPKQEILITEQQPEEAWASPAVPAPVDLPMDDRSATGAVGSGAPALPIGGKGNGRRGWALALASGDWDQILADVDRAGVKRTLAEASSEDLFILADAARYRRRTGLAREALLAERKRFPGSGRALDAAFLLGRLEESNERATSKAIVWYEEYLTRAPTGTYASEALGRKMIATSKLEGAARAQLVAEEYLRRFPSGTYAGAARALLRTP